MDYTSDTLLEQDRLRGLASQEFILDSSTADEQMGFIKQQIQNPFEGGDVKYFKRLRKSVSDPNIMDERCRTILGWIEDAYPNVEFDLKGSDMRLVDFTDATYKFFVKNVRKVVYAYLKEYIFNNKNRRALVADHKSSKLNNYPKEQYGQKENYILIVKMPEIVKDITKMDIALDTMIDWVKRRGDLPFYFGFIDSYVDQGYIQDHGVYEDIMTKFRKSECYDSICNDLKVAVTEAIILPCLKETGLEGARLDIIEPEDEDLDADNDDDNYEGGALNGDDNIDN